MQFPDGNVLSFLILSFSIAFAAEFLAGLLLFAIEPHIRRPTSEMVVEQQLKSAALPFWRKALYLAILLCCVYGGTLWLLASSLSVFTEWGTSAKFFVVGYIALVTILLMFLGLWIVLWLAAQTLALSLSIQSFLPTWIRTVWFSLWPKIPLSILSFGLFALADNILNWNVTPLAGVIVFALLFATIDFIWAIWLLSGKPPTLYTLFHFDALVRDQLGRELTQREIGKIAKPELTADYIYHPIRFEDREPFSHPYPRQDAPRGHVWLRGVKFTITECPYVADDKVTYQGIRGLRVQPNRSNVADIKEVDIHVESVNAVFMLIVAGHSYKRQENLQFENNEIGRIELHFREGPFQPQPLILGGNIREWAFKTKGVVGTLSDDATVQIWEPLDGWCTLDMLRIEIEGGPKTLERIRIIGKFGGEGTLQRAPFPAIHVCAITCRTQRKEDEDRE